MAVRTTLADVQSIPDPLNTNSFTLNLGTLPGGAGATGRDLKIRCQSAVLPGVSNEILEVPLGAHTVRHRGKIVYTGSMSVGFVEGSNAGVLKALRAWHEFVVSTQSGNSSGYKDDYAITARLSLFDITETVAYEHNIFGLFISNIEEIALDSASAAIIVNATFTYDYSEEV